MPKIEKHSKQICFFLDGIPKNSLNLNLYLGHQQVKLSKTRVSPWFRPFSRSAHAFGAALGLGSLAFVGGDLGLQVNQVVWVEVKSLRSANEVSKNLFLV
jgi:hypothetical protein